MGKAAKSEDGENASTLLLAYLTFSSPSNSHKSTKIFAITNTHVYSDTSGPWQQRVTLVKMNPHSGLPSFFNVSTLKIILSNFVIRIIANP